jgi:large subunit ribosomal protein L13
VETTDKITRSIRKEDVDRKWWVVDASGKTVGRLSTQVATLLRGKHKAYFTPHVDCGDYVIVINAEKINIIGKRPEQKKYFHYTGYPGGDRFESYKELLIKKPEFIVEHAVKGMLPKNRLGRVIIKKLKVYRGGIHPHAAQMPENLELKYS